MTRRRYVPLGLHFAHGDTGTAILAKHGNDGLLVWVCLIAAAKRSSVPGQYIHVSDNETWGNFGILASPPTFTFDAFLSTTGRMKKTSRRRSGRLLYVTLTDFGKWNAEWKQDQSAEQKASTRALSSKDIKATDGGQVADRKPPELEGEVEGEYEGEEEPPYPPPGEPPAAAAKPSLAIVKVDKSERDAVWDALVIECGNVTTRTARTLRGKVAKEIIDAGGTASEVIRRADRIRLRYPGADLTDASLMKHWDKADLPLPDDGRGQRPEELAAQLRANNGSFDLPDGYFIPGVGHVVEADAIEDADYHELEAG